VNIYTENARIVILREFSVNEVHADNFFKYLFSNTFFKNPGLIPFYGSTPTPEKVHFLEMNVSLAVSGEERILDNILL